MTAALLLGAGFGLGLVAVLRGLFPPRPTLAAFLARVTSVSAPAALVRTEEGGWISRIGQPFISLLADLGLPGQSLRRDLAVLGRPAAQLLAEKATTALVGLLLPTALTFVLSLGGVTVGWQAATWAALALAAAGFMVPDLIVRAEAAKRRAEFRNSLSSFLDLVVISLAGGAGVEAALTYGATVGTGWAFDQIRRALDAAQLARRPPWQSLGDLGHELDVEELVELAGSVALAGTEGAKVRASLAVKAAGLRAHQLADAETRAQAATERLSLPVVLLFAGFLILIGFPAIANVLIDF